MKANIFLVVLTLAAKLAAAQSPAPDAASGIYFVGTNSMFAASLSVSNGATVLWTFADGTTSSAVVPAKNYGSAGVRTNWLQVSPWSALAVLNVGFDGGDGPDLAPHKFPVTFTNTSTTDFVIATGGCYSNAYNLTGFSMSWSLIQSFDFQGLTNLVDIEFYYGHLTNANVTGLAKLQRLCLEANHLAALDLSTLTSLQDLRGALNAYKTITWPASETNLWHVCVRNNNFGVNQPFQTTEFPAAQELWIWDDNQAGALNFTNSTRLVGARVYGNNFSSLNFNHSTVQEIEAENELSLTNLMVNGCTNLNFINANSCALTTPNIDSLLAALVANGKPNGNLNLAAGNNECPSPAGWASYTNLIQKGWYILFNGCSPPIPPPPPRITSINISGGTLILNATNGLAGEAYCVLASPDAKAPLSQWLPVSTNVWSAAGEFSITVPNASISASNQFYRLRLQ